MFTCLSSLIDVWVTVVPGRTVVDDTQLTFEQPEWTSSSESRRLSIVSNGIFVSGQLSCHVIGCLTIG